MRWVGCSGSARQHTSSHAAAWPPSLLLFNSLAASGYLRNTLWQAAHHCAGSANGGEVAPGRGWMLAPGWCYARQHGTCGRQCVVPAPPGCAALVPVASTRGVPLPAHLTHSPLCSAGLHLPALRRRTGRGGGAHRRRPQLGFEGWARPTRDPALWQDHRPPVRRLLPCLVRVLALKSWMAPGCAARACLLALPCWRA